MGCKGQAPAPERALEGVGRWQGQRHQLGQSSSGDSPVGEGWEEALQVTWVWETGFWAH